MDSYYPTSGFYRRALYAAVARCDMRRLLHLALALARECEYLRTWARANGMTPPRFEATAEQAELLGAELLPVAETVTRSQIRAGGTELKQPAPRSQMPLNQRGA